jgi:hypothetical protein
MAVRNQWRRRVLSNEYLFQRLLPLPASSKATHPCLPHPLRLLSCSSAGGPVTTRNSVISPHTAPDASQQQPALARSKIRILHTTLARTRFYKRSSFSRPLHCKYPPFIRIGMAMMTISSRTLALSPSTSSLSLPLSLALSPHKREAWVQMVCNSVCGRPRTTSLWSSRAHFPQKPHVCARAFT